jgi:hypothetical protein
MTPPWAMDSSTPRTSCYPAGPLLQKNINIPNNDKDDATRLCRISSPASHARLSSGDCCVCVHSADDEVVVPGEKENTLLATQGANKGLQGSTIQEFFKSIGALYVFAWL